MEQSTKLFLVLGFMFVIFTTRNGHLEKYLRVIFGAKGAPVNGHITGNGLLDDAISAVAVGGF